jgi:hypothetical protein
MFSHSNLVAAGLLTAALSFSAVPRAQSIDGEVLRDPNADLATYTIDIDGPPRGTAQVFAGLFLFSSPIQLIPFGPWWLDTTFVLPLTPPLLLDPQGATQFRFDLPLDLSSGIPLTFQCLNIDVVGNLRLSNNAVALGHNAAPPQPQKNFDYTFAYDTGGSELRVAGAATPGAVVEIRVVDSSGTVATMSTTVPASGKFGLNLTVPGGVTEQHDVLVTCDGNLIDKIDLYKF